MVTSEEVWVPWEADPEIRGRWATWLMWTVNPVGRWRRQPKKDCHPTSYYLGKPAWDSGGEGTLPWEILPHECAGDARSNTLLAVVLGRCDARDMLIQYIWLPYYNTRPPFCSLRTKALSCIPARDKTNPGNGKLRRDRGEPRFSLPISRLFLLFWETPKDSSSWR